MVRTVQYLLLILIFLSIANGCTGRVEIPIPTPRPTPTSPPVPTLSPTPIKTATLLPSPTPLPTLPPNTATPSPSPTPTPAVLIGAGDIAVCGDAPELQGDEKTAALIENQIRQYPDAVVFTAGDTAYGEGSAAQLTNCFGPTWGRFKERIRPAAGNHDYMTGGGSPYFSYFGAAAGEAAQGYYSYDLGDWHIVVLNSNCNDIACGPESEQVKWLREDLQNSGKACTLAYWHHPRWSSGLAGGRFASTFWRTAAALGVDVVVNGDDHDYERFAPMDAEGNADPNGVREFVVGTGGALLRQWGEIRPNSEVRYNGTHGIIQFKLSPGRYEWAFIPAEDTALTDMGSGACR